MQRVVDAVTGANTNPALQKVQEYEAPRLAAIYLKEMLYRLVCSLHRTGSHSPGGTAITPRGITRRMCHGISWNFLRRASGYAASYFIYLRSEMLDDAAYAWFDEHGGVTGVNR